MAFDYGVDLSCVSDLSDEGRTVSGIRLLAEALVRRLSTPRGMVLDAPDFGTDLREFLHEDVDALALVRIASETRLELLKDERVIDASIEENRFDRETETLFLTIAVEADGGLIRLAISVTDVTVELLTAEEI